MENNDIIAAIITPIGTSSIGVIRISGNKSICEFRKIFKGRDLTKVKSHTVHYGHILNNKNEIIDEVMVSVFKAPKTFTTEDTIEVSTHGGILVLQMVLERILSLNIRLARPGEFSERAFLNGRIDLVQAESIMDLIHAKNEKAVKVANLGINSKTSDLVNVLKDKLLTLIAQIEVNIDYPEYDDAIIMSKELILPEVKKLIEEMNSLIQNSKKTQLIREGIKTVIIGKPNVGKSSLLNELASEEKAIVTDIEGTTRDVIEVNINLKGISLKLIDTAGIRKTDDIIEKLGIEKSRKAIKEAELVLLVLDNSKALTKEDTELLELTKDKTRILVVNKSDLDKKIIINEEVVLISTTKKIGIENLENKILEKFNLTDLNESDFNNLSNIRHITKMNEAREALEDVLEAIKSDYPVDLYAIDLTRSWNALCDILGMNSDDQLLTELFSKFCLGK